MGPWRRLDRPSRPMRGLRKLAYGGVIMVHHNGENPDIPTAPGSLRRTASTPGQRGRPKPARATWETLTLYLGDLREHIDALFGRFRCCDSA
jgi:hypothetical protein